MTVLIAAITIILVFFYWRPTAIAAGVLLVILLGLGLHSVVEALPADMSERIISSAPVQLLATE
jgi:membrane-bound metal-dependent hydrolase YbcI (DUF457 family)